MNVRKKLSGDRCRCPTCGEYFNSTGMFDRHRVGRYRPMERRFLTTAEMAARGYVQNAGEFWIRSRRTVPTVTQMPGSAIGTDPLPTQGVAAVHRRTPVPVHLAGKHEAAA